MQEQGRLKTRIRTRIRTAITLLIILGSCADMLAAVQSGGPYFDIFKTHVDRSYDITDHLSVHVDQEGAIKLVLSKYQFSIDAKEKASHLQHIEEYPDLYSNEWTKQWKASDLPIFCKAEHRIQQKSGIAFRFRLGSLDYVNALEGK